MQHGGCHGFLGIFATGISKTSRPTLPQRVSKPSNGLHSGRRLPAPCWGSYSRRATCPSPCAGELQRLYADRHAVIGPFEDHDLAGIVAEANRLVCDVWRAEGGGGHARLDSGTRADRDGMVDRQPYPDGESGDHGYGRNEPSRHSTSVPMRRINEASKGYQKFVTSAEAALHLADGARPPLALFWHRSGKSGGVHRVRIDCMGSSPYPTTSLPGAHPAKDSIVRDFAIHVSKFRWSCAGGFSSRIKHDGAARATNAGSAQAAGAGPGVGERARR